MSDDERPRGVRLVRDEGPPVRVDDKLIRQPEADHDGIRVWQIPVARETLRSVREVKVSRLPPHTEIRIVCQAAP